MIFRKAAEKGNITISSQMGRHGTGSKFVAFYERYALEEGCKFWYIGCK